MDQCFEIASLDDRQMLMTVDMIDTAGNPGLQSGACEYFGMVTYTTSLDRGVDMPMSWWLGVRPMAICGYLCREIFREQLSIWRTLPTIWSDFYNLDDNAATICWKDQDDNLKCKPHLYSMRVAILIRANGKDSLFLRSAAVLKALLHPLLTTFKLSGCLFYLDTCSRSNEGPSNFSSSSVGQVFALSLTRIGVVYSSWIVCRWLSENHDLNYIKLRLQRLPFLCYVSIIW